VLFGVNILGRQRLSAPRSTVRLVRSVVAGGQPTDGSGTT
jgi:hypothetical protein